MIVSFENLGELRKRYSDKRIVLAGGVFDLLHKGHITFLENLRNYGDVVVVAVSSDARVKARKGITRPIQGQDDRARIIDAIRHVDYVLVAPVPTEEEAIPTQSMIRALRPEAFVTIDEAYLEYRDNVERLGTQLVVLMPEKENSTTDIIGRILGQKG